MQNPNFDHKRRLVSQWQADADSLKTMVNDMQREIVNMQEAKSSGEHIQLRQEMIIQYETTISKLEALIEDND